MSSQENQSSSELTEDEKKLYVQRLMKMRCTYGSLDNYVNISKDHGVVAGSDQQPLLNANDHIAGENIIHFGKCHAPDNPKYKVARFVGESFGSISVDPSKAADFLEKIGVIAVNCEPKIDEVWENVNENNILDGAPALLMGSCVTCRYGGTITFVKPDQEDMADAQAGDDADEVDYVKEDTYAVIADAINKISAASKEENPAVQEAQMYLLEATVLPAAEAESACASLMDGYFEAYMEAYFSKALVCSEQQSEENYMHNVFVPFEGDFLDENRMIIDQSGMEAFKINNFDVSQAGCGAVAAYNTLRLVDPEAVPPFADVIQGMEEYGLYCNTYGLMPAGITNYLMSDGLQVSYETTDLADKIGEADAGIVMYITDEGTHYVTCAQNEDGSFAFYNLPGGEGVESFEEFEALIGEDAVTMMALTVSKSEG